MARGLLSACAEETEDPGGGSDFGWHHFVTSRPGAATPERQRVVAPERESHAVVLPAPAGASSAGGIFFDDVERWA
jgi:hypothetical protein